MSTAGRLLLATAAALVLAAAPAHAFEAKVATAAPADPKAGQHSDVKLRIELSGGQVRDVDIHFPPGLVGDPNATDRCTHAQFESTSCPPATKVGTSTTQATLLGVPQTLQGEIFNMQPRGAEPARLGIVIRPPMGQPIRLESPVTSRTTDGGLDSTLRDIPNKFQGVDITITALDVTLLGTAPTGKSFMQNPTSCGRAETAVEVRSYTDERAQARGGYDSTNCLDLPFRPTFEAVAGAPGQTARRANPPFTTVVGQSPGEANVKRVAVALPTALAVAAERLNRACPQARFEAGTCDALARVGEATALTPRLPAPRQGPVLFVEGAGLPDIVLQLTGPLSLTLRGRNEFTPTGQVTTFEGIPDVPLSRFELRFLGGFEGLLVASRDLCQGEAPQVTARFTSHAGGESTVTVPTRIEGCGAGGPATPIAPTLLPRPKISVKLGAVRRGRPSLRLRVDALTQRVRRVRLNLPRGMRLHPRTRLRGATARSKRHAIEIPTRSGGTRTVGLTLRSGTLTVARRLRRAKRLRFTVVVTETSGRRTTRRVTARPGR
ncbi:MAG TPA: hypothetical protein VGW10_16220 [Solirubrobacteraceae bacterium]|nr:hypothetical protein [Solirubrobacteraceae bacterium]